MAYTLTHLRIFQYFMSVQNIFKDYIASVDLLYQKKKDLAKLESRTKLLNGFHDLAIDLVDKVIADNHRYNQLTAEIKDLEDKIFCLKDDIVNKLTSINIDYGCNILTHINNDEYYFWLSKNGTLSDLDYRKL